MERTTTGKIFTLKKIKINDSLSASATWEELETTEHGEETSTHSAELNHMVHNDLFEAMQELDFAIKEVFRFPAGALSGGVLTVREATFTGQDETEGIKITAEIATEAGIDCKLSTHRIKYADQVYDIEPELKEVADRIKREAHKYLFLGKYDKQDPLFNETDDNDDLPM